jgi:hypothetical protein
LVDLVTWPQRTTDTGGWTAPYKFQAANTKAAVKPVIRWHRDGHTVWVLWVESQSVLNIWKDFKTLLSHCYEDLKKNILKLNMN